LFSENSTEFSLRCAVIGRTSARCTGSAMPLPKRSSLAAWETPERRGLVGPLEDEKIDAGDDAAAARSPPPPPPNSSLDVSSSVDEPAPAKRSVGSARVGCGDPAAGVEVAVPNIPAVSAVSAPAALLARPATCASSSMAASRCQSPKPSRQA
jgi:hypothetical protein